MVINIKKQEWIIWLFNIWKIWVIPHPTTKMEDIMRFILQIVTCRFDRVCVCWHSPPSVVMSCSSFSFSCPTRSMQVSIESLLMSLITCTVLKYKIIIMKQIFFFMAISISFRLYTWFAPFDDSGPLLVYHWMDCNQCHAVSLCLQRLGWFPAPQPESTGGTQRSHDLYCICWWDQS